MLFYMAVPVNSMIVSSIHHCNEAGDIKIQHYVDLTSERQCKSMKFIVARPLQSYGKHEVVINENGYFSMYSQYGKLRVTEPVIAAIIYIPEVLLVSIFVFYICICSR